MTLRCTRKLKKLQHLSWIDVRLYRVCLSSFIYLLKTQMHRGASITLLTARAWAFDPYLEWLARRSDCGKRSQLGESIPDFRLDIFLTIATKMGRGLETIQRTLGSTSCEKSSRGSERLETVGGLIKSMDAQHHKKLGSWQESKGMSRVKFDQYFFSHNLYFEIAGSRKTRQKLKEGRQEWTGETNKVEYERAYSDRLPHGLHQPSFQNRRLQSLIQTSLRRDINRCRRYFSV